MNSFCEALYLDIFQDQNGQSNCYPKVGLQNKGVHIFGKQSKGEKQLLQVDLKNEKFFS